MKTFISGWYAILPSRDVKTYKPKGIVRFGIPLVLWRDDKKRIIVMQDRCPHRGAKLSLGKICKAQLRCPYHGYQFKTDGECSYAPEFSRALPGLTVTTFAAKEAIGMIWIKYGTADNFAYPELQQLHSSFQEHYSQTQRCWNSHITYCIENQLDYTHLKYVHHNTIGKGFKLPTQPRYEYREDSIRIFFHGDRPVLTYYFPNTWILNISEKMKVLIFFSPINETETLLYLRTYRNFLNLRLVKPLVDSIMKISNRIILRQDEKVVRSQGTFPSYLAKDDKLLKHDAAIRYFRTRWCERLSLEK